MGKARMNAFIQLFGILGIIGSLLFVGLEMRQSQRIALAAQQQSRLEVWSEMTNVYTERGLSMFEMMNELLNSESYDENYELAAHNWLFQRILIFESDFVQYRAGLMERPVWEAKLQGIQSVYSSCKNRRILDFYMPYVHQDLHPLFIGNSSMACY